MVLAHQLMVHDLVEAALFELRNIKAPFGRLGEDDQQEVIDRITKQAEEVVWTAVGIISSRSVDTIPIKIADSKFKEKNITVTGVVDAQDPNRHGLIDLSGKLALLVLAPNDYAEGVDGIRAERDQKELPLSAADIASGMGLDQRQEQQLELAEQQTQQNPKDDSDVVDAKFPEGGFPCEKEFGAYDYDEAAQVIVVKAASGRFEAAWVQSRLAIESDKASTLLLRLLDNGVIKLESEGPTRLENSYKVVATLEDVV
ncbi:DNA translocase FtsK [Pseudomonas chlororaphis]|uniref:DNA translocase FtsK n=1 Tax=Pseudomonas chlororaphis TaxID=587753 RepID=UPI001CB9D20C|nr:DNA translocase FtsK [Pseudomonas chlororaphis]